jgi:hypothetical protein
LGTLTPQLVKFHNVGLSVLRFILEEKISSSFLHSFSLGLVPGQILRKRALAISEYVRQGSHLEPSVYDWDRTYLRYLERCTYEIAPTLSSRSLSGPPGRILSRRLTVPIGFIPHGEISFTPRGRNVFRCFDDSGC